MKNKVDTSTLTKDQLWELEQNNHSKSKRVLNIIVSVLPVLGCAIALMEYYLIPDKYANSNPERYAVLLVIPVVVYVLLWIRAMLSYVKEDSDIENYDDLRGKTISVPNGIGASDYNITARLMLEAGINPLEDVTLTPVDKEACVAAMDNGEIDAALLGESYGYQLVNEGVLKKIDSKDGDSRNELCCIIMMNRDFVKENPITASKLASAVKKALKWMGENPEETTDLLMKLGLEGDDREQNLALNTEMEFGLLNYDEEYITEQMRGIVEDYIEVGLITAMDDVDEVLELLWNPIGSAE